MKTKLFMILFLIMILMVSFTSKGLASAWKQTTSNSSSMWYILPSNGYIYGLTPQNPGAPGSYIAYWSKISTDGSLGTWTTTNIGGNSTYGGQAVCAYSTYLYVSGGYSPNLNLTNTYYATVSMSKSNPDGTLSQFTMVNGMLTPRAYHTMVAYNGYLYALGGENASGPFGSDAPLSSVEYSRINSDGTLAGWQTTSSMQTTTATAWAYNGYLWVYDVNTLIERALINTNGSVSTWQVIDSSDFSPTSNIVTAANGYNYVMFGDGTVYKFQSLADGTITNPEPIEPLIIPNNDTLVTYQNYLYAFGSDVEYNTIPALDIEFFTASDTDNFVYESAPGTDTEPTISWVSSYNGSTTGVLMIQFTQANQGIKMTLFKAGWFGSISTNWYEMKAQVGSDDTTYPNDLYAVGILYNGAYTPPMDISAHGLYSLSTGVSYLYDFQQSYGGTSMYPQLTFKNNDVYPATMYLESVEVEPITQPGN